MRTLTESVTHPSCFFSPQTSAQAPSPTQQHAAFTSPAIGGPRRVGIFNHKHYVCQYGYSTVAVHKAINKTVRSVPKIRRSMPF